MPSAPTTFRTPDWEGTPKTPFWKLPPLFTTDKQRLPSSPAPAAPPTLLDRLLPPRRYLNLSRRTLLLLLALLLLILSLTLGLSLGLGLRPPSPTTPLPLPGPPSTHHTGDLTYYSPGPGYGACGYTNTSAQLVCALSHLVFDAASISGNPNENPLCGRRLRVRRTDERDGKDKSVDVMVVDRCVGCEATDVDLSPAAFGRLAAEERGRVGGVWGWLE